ncbi:MAG: CDP-alcohol phosphatidyltransferase family protein [Bacteroides sp.]|nr:MAG: CDP-alcohol phosphatidyltransferase family protein [Bacteroides sp.]
MIKYLANIITIINIIVFIFNIGMIMQKFIFCSCVLVFFSAILDFLDGFFAKKFNTISKFGKNIDTISDILNFGLIPSLVFFVILNDNLTFNPYSYIVFLITFFASIRLSLFDDTKPYFIGVPVTLIGIITMSIVLLLYKKLYLIYEYENLLYLFIIFLSISMILPIKIFYRK